MAGLCSCSFKSARRLIGFTGFQEYIYGFGIWDLGWGPWNCTR
jgi:hypothetical protein